MDKLMEDHANSKKQAELAQSGDTAKLEQEIEARI
jgi:hypothetical protein